MRYYYKQKDGNSTLNLKSPLQEDLSLYEELTEEEYIEFLTELKSNKQISQKSQIKKQIIQLKNNLKESDYKAIKFAEGELSAEEYEPIKAQRIEWRVQINELEEQLASLLEEEQVQAEETSTIEEEPTIEVPEVIPTEEVIEEQEEDQE